MPLRVILRAVPLDGTKSKIIATDGYGGDLQEALNDDQVSSFEKEMLRLIAGNYEGGYWVKIVNKIVVE